MSLCCLSQPRAQINLKINLTKFTHHSESKIKYYSKVICGLAMSPCSVAQNRLVCCVLAVQHSLLVCYVHTNVPLPQSPYTLHYAAPFSKNLSLPQLGDLDPHLTHPSLIHRPKTHIEPVCHFLRIRTDRQTDKMNTEIDLYHL